MSHLAKASIGLSKMGELFFLKCNSFFDSSGFYAQPHNILMNKNSEDIFDINVFQTMPDNQDYFP